MSEPEAPTRRERVRQQTVAEIRALALAQVDDHGAEALSLNAIAKAMGMSGPALYRYFASREDLLATLVTESYAQLTAAVQAAAQHAARRAPARRLGAIIAGYREWALAHPRRYALLFGPRPDGFADPAEGIAAINDAMVALLDALRAIAPEAASGRDP